MPFNTKISVTDEYSTQFPSHCDVFTEYSRLGKKSRKELENKRPQDSWKVYRDQSNIKSYTDENYGAVLVSKLKSHFIVLVLHFMLYFSNLM